MKYLLVLLIFPFISASECGSKKNKVVNETVTDSIPVCIRKMINERKKETPPDPAEQVDEYLYNGKTVFLFTAPCCDQWNELYDDSCKIICAPTGGITGRGDGKCKDFSETAVHVKVIWKNSKK